MELIDKQLEADLVELDENEKIYSPQDENSIGDVEQWLDQSRRELMEPVPDHGNITDQPHQPRVPAHDTNNVIGLSRAAAPHFTPMQSQRHVPPAPPQPEEATGINATIQKLASAVKDLASTSAPNKQLLSRLCAPKQLLEYSGDPLE
jgi:hypothetical protein